MRSFILLLGYATRFRFSIGKNAIEVKIVRLEAKKGIFCMFYNEAKQQKSEAEQVQMKQNKRSKTKNVKQNDAKIPILKQNKKM
jgi:hypothetical protein